MSKIKESMASQRIADEGIPLPVHPVNPEVSAPEQGDIPLPDAETGEWIQIHSYDEENPTPAPPVPQNFKILGYNQGTYYYLGKRKGQIIGLVPPQHNLNFLFQLAPRDWWYKHFPKKDAKDKVVGISFEHAIDILFQRAYTAGIFKAQTAQRGGGIWLDRRRLVLHVGANLLVDGAEQDTFSFVSAFVYQKSQPIITLAKEALSDEDSREFLDIICNLSWRDPMHGMFVAGWIVTAAMSGALEWRPHIYISAQEGAGKSWLNTNIITPALGDYALKLGGGTTEAGLRRQIEQDARPVILDEMEGEDKRQLETRQSIILLTRKSSSGEKIIHASTTSDGIRQYNLYSSFMISSINIGVKEAADMDRFMRVDLIKRDNPEKFKAIEKRVSALMTEDFSARLLRRIADNGKVFLKNLEVFRDVITDITGDRRSGQQIGSLIAGAFFFMNGHEVSYEIAREYCLKNDITAYSESKKTPSHEALLEYLLSCIISVNTSAKRVDMQIGTLIADCADNFDYESALALHDIRVIKGMICLKKPSQHIDRLLKETPWRDSWATTILRVSGVTESKNPERFGKITARQIKIPMRKEE